jgi:PAS domain S-box-containing protein
MAKILIIDDRPLNRQFLTTLLGYQHHDLREASDGVEGLRAARDQRSDLIISDVLMPTMDGYEFVRRLREDADIGKTPVIFSTAHYLSRESRALADKCGVASIIYKPCEPQAVLDIVAAALGQQPASVPAPLPRPGDFDREHLRLVTDKVAEKADQLRDVHGKLTAMIELSADLAQERDPVQLLNRYCSVAREVIGARWTMVVLLKRNRKAVEHLRVVGIDVENIPALQSALLETGVFKTLVNEGRTICLSDVTSIPAALRLPDSLPRAASLLVAPLVMRGHVDGWICLADKLGFDAFSQEDEQLASALAAQMAVAYANARLYSDSIKYANKLEAEITQRASVERQLSESKAQLAGIISSAMDSIVTVDSDQRIVMFNRAAEKMFRCAAAEAIGQPLDRFIPPRFRASHSQDIRKFGETDVVTRALATASPVSGLRPDGQEFPLEASISQVEVGGQKLYTIIMRDITERKSAEEKVRESEQRLQAVIENLSEGLVVSDLNGQLLHWNQAALEIHGFASPEECLFKLPEFAKIFELSDLDGSVLDIEQWPLPRIIRGERLRNLEVRIRRLNAEWNRVFSYGGAIVHQANGSFAAVVTMSDITDRKLAQETASKLASIVESSHDAIIGKTLDGIITSWNQSAQKLYGYSAEEVLERSVAILAPADHSDEIDAILERLRRGDRIEDFETERITKEGKRISVSITISPIRGKSGAVSGWSTIARDITERNRSEEARRASELRYRRLFESAKDGILILNAETGLIVDANPYIIKALGYAYEELIGKELWEIGFFRDASEAKKAFEELQDSGYLRYEDLPLKTRGGLTIEVEVVANVYPVGDSKVIQCNIRDISERRRGERALEETNRKLEATLGELSATTQQLWQASKLATVGELSASIAHELNNPLATVALRLENLLMQMTAGDQKRHSLEIITQEVDRMANLVDNLLQFSRRGHRQITTVNVGEEISKSVDFVHYHLRTHKIEVVREFADPLPTVQADCQQLRQLFLNLLTNASDAMPQGGTLIVRAKTSGLDESEAVQIDFADTGEGIAPENLKRIWEPFFTTKMEGKGTGLGLAICRRIVEEHGGAIEIESTVGWGTTVRMLFPATVKGARVHSDDQ